MENKTDWTWVLEIPSSSKWNQGGSVKNTKHDWMFYTS